MLHYGLNDIQYWCQEDRLREVAASYKYAEGFSERVGGGLYTPINVKGPFKGPKSESLVDKTRKTTYNHTSSGVRTANRRVDRSGIYSQFSDSH